MHFLKRRARVGAALFCLVLAQCGDAGTPTQPEPPDTPPPATGPNLELFDSLMVGFMRTHGIRTAALGIMRHDVVVYRKSFGWQDSLHTRPASDTVMMRLASVSKPIAAAAIHHLIADGLLSLDARVFDVGQPGGGILKLEPFPSLGDARIADITIRHLLQHGGGWDREAVGDLTYRELAIAEAMQIPSPPGRVATVRYILGQPLQFTPGTTSAYSNIGYLVLGLVVEQLSGTDYMSYIHTKIFGPLGVPRADVIQGRTFPADRDPREPWYDSAETASNVFDPYGPRVRSPDGGWHHEARVAQGGLVASTRALLAFANAYQVNGDDIGTRRTRTESAAWRWNHTGSLPGSQTLIRQRGDGINYVVLFNRDAPSGTSYPVLIRAQMDALLDGSSVRWQ